MKQQYTGGGCLFGGHDWCRGVWQGVKLLFYNSAADVLLLDIPSNIPNSFKPFYIGETLKT